MGQRTCCMHHRHSRKTWHWRGIPIFILYFPLESVWLQPANNPYPNACSNLPWTKKETQVQWYGVNVLWFSLSFTSSLHFIPLGLYSFAYLHEALLVFLIFLSILRYDSLWLVFTSRLCLPFISALLLTLFHHEAAPPLCLIALWLVLSIIRLALDPIVYLYKPL